MKSKNEWIRWTRWDDGPADSGQMPVDHVDDEMQQFRERAVEYLCENDADHVIYGTMHYDNDGNVDQVDFYMLPLSDADFHKKVSALGSDYAIFAMHKH